MENPEGFSITRLPIVAEYGRGIANLPQLLRWQFHLLRWLIRHRHEYDIIHACDFDTVLPALFCKWRYKKKVVYDIFDFYADHLRNTPSLIKQFIRRKDFWAINRADAVIIVDDSRRKQINGSHPKRLTVIYNTPEEPVNLQKGSQPRSFKVTYVGLLQVERGLLELIEVFSRHPDWILELAGFGGDADLIRQKAAVCSNVHWHGRIGYDEAIGLSQMAAALIATYDPSIPNHRFSSPNKVFEAMMLGKPIIVPRDTNMDRIVQAANCGIVVKYGSIPELDKALMRLSGDLNLVKELGINARIAYDRSYNWTIMSERLLGLYHEIMGEIRA
jgi:glycosyltransferase involved in cell wall biosynthesis